ncbi:MAG: antibiotic biosynthesis monooxygenase [Schleiferiaceae bacterium]
MIRIVKMEFDPAKVEDFKKLFDGVKEKIRAFEGCQYLELLQQTQGGNIFFTYSVWEDEKYLENYRSSELFATVWAETKKGFAGKPEAWSVDQKVILE